jgi:hypothetical protein
MQTITRHAKRPVTRTHWDQYEVWVEQGHDWRLLGMFPDPEVAAHLALEVAHKRLNKTRVVHLIFQGTRVISRPWLSLPLWP